MKNIIKNNKLLRTLLLASSVVLGSFSAQAGVILSFSETAVEVGVNDSFNLDLLASTDVSIAADSFIAFSTDVLFDNSFLSLDSIDLGSDFTEDIFSPGIAGFFNADFTNPFSPVLTASGDDILLASLTFTAIEVGNTSLASIVESFSSLLPFQTISVESAFADVSVSAVSVPAPATLGLFGISLLVLMRLRRK